MLFEDTSIAVSISVSSNKRVVIVVVSDGEGDFVVDISDERVVEIVKGEVVDG